MNKDTTRMRITILLLLLVTTLAASAQEAHRRWRKMSQIRNDKFDLVLPEVMRENVFIHARP